MAKDVFVANLNPGTVRHEYMATFVEMLMHDLNTDRHIGYFVPRMAGGCLGIFRNMSVEHFLTTDASWYFSLDSDIQMQKDTLARLMETADEATAPIVAGLYWMSLEKGCTPSVFDYVQEDDGLYHMAPRMDVELDTVVDCAGTGAGCLLVHRTVFEKLLAEYGAPAPWFAESVHGGVSFGEDFTFCMRATAAGFPVKVNTGVEVGHVKNILLTRANRSISD